MNNQSKLEDEDPAKLEEKLRTMILGNVRIASDTNNDGRDQSNVPSRGLNKGWNSQQQYSPQRQWNNTPPRQGDGYRQTPPSLRGGNYLHRPGNRGRGGGGQHSLNSPVKGHQQRAVQTRFATQIRQPYHQSESEFNAQCAFLEDTARQHVPHLEMSREEFETKDQFRLHLEEICQRAVRAHFSSASDEAEDVKTPTINLFTFGSLSSGFGMPGSDMDLAIVTSSSPHLELLRVVEKAILVSGHGAHLLTRTRVPIIKVCEAPTPELYDALCEERNKWDQMTPEERDKYDNPVQSEDDSTSLTKEDNMQQNVRVEELNQDATTAKNIFEKPNDADQPRVKSLADGSTTTKIAVYAKDSTTTTQDSTEGNNITAENPSHQDPSFKAAVHPTTENLALQQHPQQPKKTPWYREKRPGPLDFPKDGIGIQCDINAHNPLGLHNTLLLRCYSYCDVRVRLIVLFVKAWASQRKINSSRHGTLSSYGYVLMVLHYLVNIVQPPVCPNLQLTNRSVDMAPQLSETCDGYDVKFWKNEAEIQDLAQRGALTQNREPLGTLLRGFFHYYAQQGYNVPNGGFSWTMQVLSLRTPGGILTKESKGWTGARTVIKDHKEVRHRYLFAIEDPFELDHNVARTVTHNGIVAIRDEFRRAWRLIFSAGRSLGPPNEQHDLFAPVIETPPPPPPVPPTTSHEEEEQSNMSNHDQSFNNGAREEHNPTADSNSHVFSAG